MHRYRITLQTVAVPEGINNLTCSIIGRGCLNTAPFSILYPVAFIYNNDILIIVSKCEKS